MYYKLFKKYTSLICLLRSFYYSNLKAFYFSIHVVMWKEGMLHDNQTNKYIISAHLLNPRIFVLHNEWMPYLTNELHLRGSKLIVRRIKILCNWSYYKSTTSKIQWPEDNNQPIPLKNLEKWNTLPAWFRSHMQKQYPMWFYKTRIMNEHWAIHWWNWCLVLLLIPSASFFSSLFFSLPSIYSCKCSYAIILNLDLLSIWIRIFLGLIAD